MDHVRGMESIDNHSLQESLFGIKYHKSAFWNSNRSPSSLPSSGCVFSISVCAQRYQDVDFW